MQLFELLNFVDIFVLSQFEIFIVQFEFCGMLIDIGNNLFLQFCQNFNLSLGRHKDQAWHLNSPYTPWGTLEVSTETNLK